jgi:hypothetical protein
MRADSSHPGPTSRDLESGGDGDAGSIVVDRQDGVTSESLRSRWLQAKSLCRAASEMAITAGCLSRRSTEMA